MDYKKIAKEDILPEYNFQKGFGVNNFREIILAKYKSLSIEQRNKISWKSFFKKVSKECQNEQPSKRANKIKNAIKDAVDNLIECPVDIDYIRARENEDRNIDEEESRGVPIKILRDLGYATH